MKNYSLFHIGLKADTVALLLSIQIYSHFNEFWGKLRERVRKCDDFFNLCEFLNGKQENVIFN